MLQLSMLLLWLIYAGRWWLCYKPKRVADYFNNLQLCSMKVQWSFSVVNSLFSILNWHCWRIIWIREKSNICAQVPLKPITQLLISHNTEKYNKAEFRSSCLTGTNKSFTNIRITNFGISNSGNTNIRNHLQCAHLVLRT